jgi:type III secretion protein V
MYNEQAGFYGERWNLLQKDFYHNTGMRLPSTAVLPNSHLPRGGFQVTVGGTTVITGEIAPDAILIEAVPDIAESFGFEVIEEASHPINGTAVFWVPASAMYRRIADAAEMRVFDPVEYIFIKTATFLRAHPEEILAITDVHRILKKLEADYPGLLQEALGGQFMNVSRVTDVLQELAREGVPIRDVRQVFEAIASYCSTYSYSMGQNDDFDLQDIVTYVRTARKRQAVSGLVSNRGVLRLCTVSSTVEALFGNVKYDGNARSIALDVEQFESLRAGLQAVIRPVRNRGVFPVAVLVPPELRHKVTAFIRACNDTIRVVTFDELDPSMRVEPVGVWGV